MILAAHQPQFCPWLGYFDKMRRADVFVFLDDVQFKKNEWQNRNRIKTQNGPAWLTVPVLHNFGQDIRQVRVNNTIDWNKKSQATLKQSYARAKAFSEAADFIEKLLGQPWELLVDINLYSVRWLAERLKVGTETKLSSELGVPGHSTERLVNLCKALGAGTYLAGAGGRDYMDMDLFKKAGIEVQFQDYAHPVYPQLHGEFVPNLSALDLILNVGDDGASIAFR